MPTDQWHYARDGKSSGPISFVKLQELGFQGLIRANDMVWQQGMTQWQPAGEIKGLLPPTLPPSPANMPPPIPVASYAYTPPQDIGDNAGIRMLLPVGRSGWAIAAGYLGLFSVLILPAPIALFCAIMAIREMRQDSHKHGVGRAVFGGMMGLLGTCGLLLMFLVMTKVIH